MMLRLLFALVAIIGIPPVVAAQDFPSHPITVVIPFTPGGALDFLLKTIQEKVEKALGQPLILENRPGATGNVGNAYVAKATPDGYILLMTA